MASHARRLFAIGLIAINPSGMIKKSIFNQGIFCVGHIYARDPVRNCCPFLAAIVWFFQMYVIDAGIAQGDSAHGLADALNDHVLFGEFDILEQQVVSCVE